jgi:hypothetical protein
LALRQTEDAQGLAPGCGRKPRADALGMLNLVEMINKTHPGAL